MGKLIIMMIWKSIIWKSSRSALFKICFSEIFCTGVLFWSFRIDKTGHSNWQDNPDSFTLKIKLVRISKSTEKFGIRQKMSNYNFDRAFPNIFKFDSNSFLDQKWQLISPKLMLFWKEICQHKTRQLNLFKYLISM